MLANIQVVTLHPTPSASCHAVHFVRISGPWCHGGGLTATSTTQYMFAWIQPAWGACYRVVLVIKKSWRLLTQNMAAGGYGGRLILLRPQFGFE